MKGRKVLQERIEEVGGDVEGGGWHKISIIPLYYPPGPPVIRRERGHERGTPN